MSKLYLYNYNNYFNRLFKRETSLANYGTPIYTLDNTNFRYADGVDTDHIINYTGTDGDYVIITDSNNNILHRWFVIDDNTTRGGQRRLVLHRDLRVDYYDIWRGAPMIVHRGWPKYFGPIIFNSEGFSFNQRKEYEDLLMDESFTPWYIIYFAKNCPSASGSITMGTTADITINTPITESLFANGSSYTCYDNREIFTNSNQDETTWTSPMQHLRFYLAGSGTHYYVQSGVGRDRSYIWFDQNTATVRSQLGSAFSEKYSTWSSDSYFGKTNDVNTADRQKLNLGSLIVKDSTNALFQVDITKTTNYGVKSTTVTETLSNAMKTAIDATSLTRTGDWGDEAFGIEYDEVVYTVSAVQITTGTVSWTIDFSSKQNTVDADYNIIAIPKKSIHAYQNDDWHTIQEDWSQALLESILRSTYSDGGETKPLKNYIYDVQLLPYCPYNKALLYDFDDLMGTIYLDEFEYATGVKALDSNQYYYNSNGSDGNICMLYVKNSQFEFDITKFYDEFNGSWWVHNINLQPQQYQQNGDIVNYKIDNECRLYRLCSPNYNGLFEFSVAKNDGVNQFNVDVTLRPQNPYIHINPNFKYLYGKDFNDARGLICQGDFSLPIVNDQWQTYEYQNKNYQNIFNRQMENLDFNQSQERIQSMVGLIGGSITGGATGTTAGAIAGGLPGAIAGGVVGGVGSAVAGIADYAMLGARQAEQRDFAIDNYKYQLGNVKALSYSINKVTPLTNNNKIWPFIEIYDCTDTEKDMLYKKLIYTSFTIEKIDTLSNYGEEGQLRFFQATPIRLDDANCSTHELDVLAKELEKGVYI